MLLHEVLLDLPLVRLHEVHQGALFLGQPPADLLEEVQAFGLGVVEFRGD